MEVSFKANLVSRPYIKTSLDSSSRDYKRMQTAFVELDTSSQSDMVAVNRTANNYEKARIKKLNGFGVKEYNYAADLRDVFNHRYVRPSSVIQSKFYALTTQKNEFETLVPEKILGIVQMNDTGSYYELKYLQVDPDTNYTSVYRQYKNIGKAILNSIHKIFTEKEIFLYPDDEAIQFYKNFGYKEDEKQVLRRAIRHL